MQTITGYIDSPGYRSMAGNVPETIDEARDGRLIGEATLGNCAAFAEVYSHGWVHPHYFITVIAHPQCVEAKMWHFQLRDGDILQWRLDDNGAVEVWQDNGEGEGSQLFWKPEVNGFRFNVA